MAAGRIRRITPVFRPISAKTVWSFVEVETEDGLIGTGEATLQGREAVLEAEIVALAAPLIGSAGHPDALPGTDWIAGHGLPRAAALSAVDQALWDIAAQRAGRPLHALLGASRRDVIALYANINRRTEDRSPGGVAASASDALAAGYEAFKIAPFDGVSPDLAGTEAGRRLIEAGIGRVAALRGAIGPDRRLMVDCHWRFDEASAGAAIQELEPYGIYWFECPLQEDHENIQALRRLRAAANARGMLLAGAEQMATLAAFRPLLEAEAYDVMMPDVKYAGGLREILRIAEAFDAAGVAFSPHNPSGPICHAASLHVSAVAEAFTLLELQFDESPAFWSIVGGDLPRPAAGASRIPASPGLGVRLA
jgi:galactonate dehydratase